MYVWDVWKTEATLMYTIVSERSYSFKVLKIQDDGVSSAVVQSWVRIRILLHLSTYMAKVKPKYQITGKGGTARLVFAFCVEDAHLW
jgi:hypothetical protein